MTITAHHPERPGDAGERARRAPTGLEGHRVDVVRRLLASGVSVRSILTILPDWEREIATAITRERDDAPL